MSRIAQTVSAIALRRRADDDVFRDALQGNASAFSEVYRRYHERVFAYCLARLMSADAAHDAANETFLRLLRADADAVRSPAAWLFGVARHVCIDVARREAGASETPLEEHVTAAACMATRAAEDEALSQEEARTVLLALRRVRPRYRAALMLREIHHESIGSIAESLGVNAATASTILSRARDAFGRAYAEVLELENGCREAVALIYRRGGTGLSAPESAALEAHLASCSSCRREAGRATETLSAPALLLLPQLEGVSRGLLARAAELFAANPAVASVPGVSGPVLDAPVTRVGTAVVTALVALTVGVNALAPAGGFSADVASRPRPAAASDPVVTGGVSPSHDADDLGGDHATALSAESRHDESLLHLSNASVHESSHARDEAPHSSSHDADGVHAVEGATGGEHGSMAGAGVTTDGHDATGDGGGGTGTSTGSGDGGAGSGGEHDTHDGGEEHSHD